MTLTRFGVHSRSGTPKKPEPAVPNAAIGTEIATINAILARLRALGLIEP